MAAAMSAVRSSTRRSCRASTSIPSIPSVPLISASPSLAASSTGARPAAARASPAGINVPEASRTSPSPISASAQCESGARSPEQPSEPCSRTTGVMPWWSRSARSRAVCRRTPVRPVASVESRSSISARTTSRSTSGPEPAACERTSERCRRARISVGMCRVASAPNPVETPYAGVSAAASSSTTARARSIAASASSPSRTPAPPRATATTWSGARGPTPTSTADLTPGSTPLLDMLSMSSMTRPRAGGAPGVRRWSCLGSETGPPGGCRT